MVRRARSEFNEVESAYLARFQKDLGRRIKGVELCSLCRALAEKSSLHLGKRQIVSKPRMLAWLAESDAEVRPFFDATLAEWIARHRTDKQ
jgi:hypothetical protein